MDRAVLFDLGNTLVCPLHTEEEIFNLIFIDIGLEQKPERAINRAVAETRREFQAAGRSIAKTDGDAEAFWTEWDAKVLARLGFMGELREPARQIHLRWFDHFVHEQFKGTEKVLQALKASGLKLAIVSNGLETEISQVMAQARLDGNYFDAIVGIDTFDSEKPEARVFLKTLERLKVEPSESVFVGDKLETDGGAARVGMRFYWLHQGEGECPEWAERIESLSELLERLS